MVTDKMRRHCSSPSGEYMMFRLFKSLLLGSVDGKILVEDDGGQMSDFIRSGRLVSERLCATSSNQRQAPCQEQLRWVDQSEFSIWRVDQSEFSILWVDQSEFSILNWPITVEYCRWAMCHSRVSTPSWTPTSSPWWGAVSSACVTVQGEHLTVTMVWTCAGTPLTTVTPTTTPVSGLWAASSSGSNYQLQSVVRFRW